MSVSIRFSFQLMVLDLTSVDNCLQFLPYKADGAMVSPPSSNGGDHLLALKGMLSAKSYHHTCKLIYCVPDC